MMKRLLIILVMQMTLLNSLSYGIKRYGTFLESPYVKRPRTSSIIGSPMSITPIQSPGNSFSRPGSPMNFSPMNPGNPHSSSIPSRRSSITTTATGTPGRITTSDMRIVNVDGRGDNCGYATCAGRSRMTIPQYNRRHSLQNQYATPGLTGHQMLNTARKEFPNTQVTRLQSGTQFQNYLNQNIQPGQTKKYGLFYTHPPPATSGHFVNLKAWKPNGPGPVQGRIVDYQQPPASRFSHDLPPANGNEYFLYDFKRRNSQK